MLITERKKMRKAASSALDTGGKSTNAGVEEIQNTESVDHWDFLDKIEAPMWADLSICDLTNDEIDDSWFETSHQFHQCSASQLLSTVFHPNSITIPDPPSPKLPTSVSKSRGKNYKIKSWEKQRNNNNPNSNHQHPVKTLTIKSSKTLITSSNITKTEPPKASSSCESGPKFSKSSLCCSSSSQEQKQEGSAKSSVTSGFLSLLKNDLRRSYATRPAARMVVVAVNGGGSGRCSEGFKSSSEKSSAGSSLNQGVKVSRVSQPFRGKTKEPNVVNAPAQKLYDRKGSKTVGRVLMPRKGNEQNQMVDKEGEKRSMKKVPSVKINTIKKAVISSEKEVRSVGVVNVQKVCKQNVVQKNGSKKVIGVKEKTDTRNRDKDTTRKVFFR